MTVVYRGSLLRLCFNWHGSLYKCIGWELLVYFGLFMIINLSYRFAMDEAQRTTFEGLVALTDSWMQRIPLQFFLGFYVSYILGRWWSIVCSMPVPDKALLLVTSYFPSDNDEDRSLRQSIARWLNLHCVLAWRMFAIKILKRFPEDTHLVESGLLSQSEYDIYNKTTAEHGRYWQPIQWCMKLIAQRHLRGAISEPAVALIYNAIYEIKGMNDMLLTYEWILPPLIYTQLAALATYGYFALCLIARQTVKQGTNTGHSADMYVPVITLLEFIFFVGWLKVGDIFRDPFKEADDDFDINYWLDRNIHTSNMIIEEVNSQEIDAHESPLWQSLHPQIPHTRASFLVRDGIPKNRVDHITFTPRQKELVAEGYKSNPIADAFDETKHMMEVTAAQVKNTALAMRNNLDSLAEEKETGTEAGTA